MNYGYGTGNIDIWAVSENRQLMLQLLPEDGGPSNQSGISVAVDGPRSLAPWLAMQTPDVLGTMAVGMVNVTPVAQPDSQSPARMFANLLAPM